MAGAPEKNNQRSSTTAALRAFLLRHGAPLYFAWKALRFWPAGWRGFLRARKFRFPPVPLPSSALRADAAPAGSGATPASTNPLQAFFDANLEGPGIWKWQHYFSIYHRHFERFRGREVHVVEIGVFSGGSLRMWREYFGPGCRVYGIDIEESCNAYAGDNIQVHIGDQADRKFWGRFRDQVPRVDIVIDDGGHLPHQQIVTFEELFPHMAAGGVYLCEDIHFAQNPFAKYMAAVSQNLHSFEYFTESQDMERRLSCRTSPFQAWCESIHIYPYVIAVEKRHTGLSEFVAPRHGTVWEPFYGDLQTADMRSANPESQTRSSGAT